MGSGPAGPGPRAVGSAPPAHTNAGVGYGWAHETTEELVMARNRNREQDTPASAPTVSRPVEAPASAVWQVLCDGWSYATWVVGASRVRDVDTTWPQEGSRVHHSFGLWPAVIQDFTGVEKAVPDTELVLTARGWPVGEARVRIEVRPVDAEHCTVSITEDAVAGPGRLMPPALRHRLLIPRNKESLFRLAMIAEGRHREARARGVRPGG